MYIAMQGLVAASVNCWWRAVGHEWAVVSLLARLLGRVPIQMISGSWIRVQLPSGLKLSSEWVNGQPSISKSRLERTQDTLRTQPISYHCRGWSELCEVTFLQQWNSSAGLSTTDWQPIQADKIQYCNAFIGLKTHPTILLKKSHEAVRKTKTALFNIVMLCKQPLRAWEGKKALFFLFNWFLVAWKLMMGSIGWPIHHRWIFPRRPSTFREDLLWAVWKSISRHLVFTVWVVFMQQGRRGGGVKRFSHAYFWRLRRHLKLSLCDQMSWSRFIKQGGNEAHRTEEKSSQTHTTEFLNLGVG